MASNPTPKRPIPLWTILLVLALIAAIAWGLSQRNAINGEHNEDDITEQLGG